MIRWQSIKTKKKIIKKTTVFKIYIFLKICISRPIAMDEEKRFIQRHINMKFQNIEAKEKSIKFYREKICLEIQRKT